MTTLYVANTSKQHNMFTFRLPEDLRPREVPIRVGAQVRISDLSPETAQRIIEQMSRYGLKSVAELQQNKGYVGLVYSIDKPVPLNNERVLNDTFTNNDEVLNEQAEIRREGVAAAVADHIQTTMRQVDVPVPHAEVEMVEETRGGNTPRLARGYEVHSEGARSRHRDSKPSARNRGGRR